MARFIVQMYFILNNILIDEIIWNITDIAGNASTFNFIFNFKFMASDVFRQKHKRKEAE